MELIVKIVTSDCSVILWPAPIVVGEVKVDIRAEAMLVWAPHPDMTDAKSMELN